MTSLQTWTTKSRETVLDYGKFLQVENHVVELPDGQIIPDWSWVVTPDFINVIAVTENGDFLIFEQTKYACGGTLAPVGGYIEPDEHPLPAAQRELLEETGYKAAEWYALGQYHVDANRGAGTAYPFLALGAHPITQPDADDLEEQSLKLLTRQQVESALTEGHFKVLPWVTALTLALRHPAYLTFFG